MATNRTDAGHKDATKIRNRRRQYLVQHPEYFSNYSESTNPVLFDALVRKWQSTAERDSRVKQKGIAEVLEAGLERAETRLALAEHGPTSSNSAEIEISQLVDVEDSPEEWTEPKDKDSAWELWKKIIGQQFINGRDDQFNYEKIDDDESLDESEHENQALLENYIEQEEGHWEVNPSEVKGETGVQDF